MTDSRREADVTESRKRGNVFLSYAYQDRETAREVQQVLVDLGFDVLLANNLPVGSDIGESITQAVLSATFLCVIFSESPPPAAVMFEAGIAAGSRRPTLIVATPKGADQLPAQLLSAPLIRYRPGLPDVLREDISAYLEHVYPISAQLTINWNVLVDKEESQPKISPLPRESDLQRDLANHLTEMGAIVSGDMPTGGGRIDLVATFPALGDAFNPVIIEIKRRVRDQDDGLKALRTYLRSFGARLGILVIGESTAVPDYLVTNGVGIVVVPASLLMQWDANRLIREITALRNQVVHSA